MGEGRASGVGRVASGTTSGARALLPRADRPSPPSTRTRAPAHLSQTVGALVADLAEILTGAGVEEAAREARDMVAAVLDVPRFWPSTHRDAVVAGSDAERARAAARWRSRGAPFAYAVGRAAFRHLTLEVDERVLIPRQETEVLVDAVLERVGHAGGIAVDIGTGSGAMALALASEGQFTRVIATDVSGGALEVARRNATRLAPVLRCPVEFRQGSLCAPLAGERVDVVVSNPPYIAYHEAPELPPSVHDWEPPIALFSSEGGMAATSRVIHEAAAVLVPGGLLALEVDARRASLAAELAMTDGHFAHISLRLDLTGRERILMATRKET